MSYNGSGTFNINTAGQPVVTGTVISSTAFNALTADLGTGLSTAITKDGQTVATARIPFAAGINSSLVTDATSTTTGSIITAGGVGIAKALFVGTTANIAGTTTLAGVTATSITDSGLTSGRVTYAGTAGLLQDSANLTFNGTTLTANTIGAFTLGGTVAGGGNQLNNVIIGTTTPLAGAFTTLSATGTVSVNSTEATLQLNTTGQKAYALISGGGGNLANGYFAIRNNTNSNNPFYIDPSAPANCVYISSTGLEVTGTLSATTTGKVGTTLGVGAATPSASGAGITFPATQSASTDANTLDDYEEGTWTPTQGAGLTVVGTFSSLGRYTKIGDTVFIEGKIAATTSLSFSSGVVCGGLPFTASSTFEAIFAGANQNSTATAIVASAGTSLYAQSSLAATTAYWFSGTYKLT